MYLYIIYIYSIYSIVYLVHLWKCLLKNKILFPDFSAFQKFTPLYVLIVYCVNRNFKLNSISFIFTSLCSSVLIVLLHEEKLNSISLSHMFNPFYFGILIFHRNHVNINVLFFFKFYLLQLVTDHFHTLRFLSMMIYGWINYLMSVNLSNLFLFLFYFLNDYFAVSL